MFALIPIFAAVVLPPTVTKSFSPPVVGINQLSMVTITITNPNSSNLTGASMNDSFTSFAAWRIHPLSSKTTFMSRSRAFASRGS